MLHGGFVKTEKAGSNHAAPRLRASVNSGLIVIAVAALATAAVAQTSSTAGEVPGSAMTSASTYSGISAQPSPPTVSLPSGNQNPFLGSVPAGKATAEVIALSFSDAINRGLQQNLGLLLSEDSTLAARSQRWKELSSLLPHLSANITETLQTLSLAQFGFRVPGVPEIIPPFNYLDARGYFTQSVFNWNYFQTERATQQYLRAAQDS